MRNILVILFLISLVCACKGKSNSLVKDLKTNYEKNGLQFEIDSTDHGTVFTYTNLKKDTLKIVVNGSDVSSPYVIFKNKEKYKEYKFKENDLQYLNARSKLVRGMEFVHYESDISNLSQSIVFNTEFVKVDSINSIVKFKLKFSGGYEFETGEYALFDSKDELMYKSKSFNDFTNGEIIDIPLQKFLNKKGIYIKVEILRNSTSDIAVKKTISDSKFFKEIFVERLEIPLL